MTINEWLLAAQKSLSTAKIHTARLDSLILLEDCLLLDRAYLLAHDDAELSTENQALLEGKLQRRVKHEPLAYIRGFSEFYGRHFFVTNAVLEPRPESEMIIDQLKLVSANASSIADIGTGSGALAITAAMETSATVYATDIDDACLYIAEQNAQLHSQSIGLAKGDLLEPFFKDASTPTPEVILANLPYVPKDYPINQAATFEPALALFGGSDGLDLYRRLFLQTEQFNDKPDYIITEALPKQHSKLALIAKQHSYSLNNTADFIQVFSATTN